MEIRVFPVRRNPLPPPAVLTGESRLLNTRGQGAVAETYPARRPSPHTKQNERWHPREGDHHGYLTRRREGEGRELHPPGLQALWLASGA